MIVLSFEPRIAKEQFQSEENTTSLRLYRQQARADVGLMFIACNLTRIWNIIRKTNTADFKAYISSITFKESILIAFDLAKLLNSRKKILAYS